jgi:ribonucleoside-diphosphate reductase alpha chain
MAIAPQRTAIGIRRRFTTEGVHPYDEVVGERRDARITDYRDGSVAFEQVGVEVPATWSLNATNILAQKYFRGTPGTPEREWSLKQVSDRVADTITRWGVNDGYFGDAAEAEAFRDELKHIIVMQKAAFNSPVWFNIGVQGVPQQASACQPYHALVSTPDGLEPIGRLVEERAVGTKVFDASGVTRIVAVKHNGVKPVLRVHTEAGHELDVTADHLVWRSGQEMVADGLTGWSTSSGLFVPAGDLRPGDPLEWCDVESFGSAPHDQTEIVGIEELGEMDVYDIQTESGEYLSSDLRVHNCFILSVDDSMDSILNWYREEGIIFKGGSGAGVNLSNIRGSTERLQGGGTASGPVSFMRGADSSAGTIKSGGRTRRSAKMVILNSDHPDIEDFIWCKALEERKARVLRDAGFDMDLDGSDAFSIQYQNANNSVRVTDEFMQAVVDDSDWILTARTNGAIVRTVKARDLFRQIAHAAWECADPGLQYDTTINRWHTAPNAGRINGSNPCFPGSAKVHTDKGLIPFAELFDRANRGEIFGIYTHDATNLDAPAERMEITSPDAFMITGFNDIVRLRFENGMELRCTSGHKIFTTNHGFVAANKLTHDDEIKVLDLPAPAVEADLALPVPCDPDAFRAKGDHSAPLRIPEEWSEDFAHYLGWLIGDGSTSGATTSTIYGSAEDREEILPRHTELAEWINGDRPIKLSEQANGTAQLRITRRQFKRFLEALGVKSVKGPEKTVPWSIEQAPAEIVAAFLRGLFDADGCVVVNRHRGVYVGLGSTSTALLRGVQRLLTTFGITSRVYKVRDATAEGAFSYTNKAGETVSYRQLASYDLRIASGPITSFAQHIGFSLSRKAQLLAEIAFGGPRGFSNFKRTTRLAERVNDGTELTYNLSESRNHSYVVDGVVVRNCSEYLHLDNSACNLSSINLLKFLLEDGNFDTEGFKSTVEVMFTAQEILVGNADYPTERIAENSRRYRELGLGYANIGALLMAQGLPYDSDEGRAWTASITALMTGHAYATSARTASRMGPFAGYHADRDAMLNVLRMHRAEVAKIEEELVPTELLSAAQEAWDSAVELGEQFGVRNSQASVLAPTGTISLLMDCDTTGIEPDLSLVKTKKLVGGGTMSIVNQTVPRALARLGYSPEQVEDIVSYIDKHKSIVGAPHLVAEHLPVFACSMGDNTIHYMGHLRMMGAAQPFVSGAISKTTNVPEEVTVEEVEQLHIDAWRLGIKAIAIYRDNCKVAQPLSTTKKEGVVVGEGGDFAPPGSEAEAKDREAAAKIAELEAALAKEQGRARDTVVVGAVRERLPRRRKSSTFAFRVADCEGYVTVGEYEDGRPGEVFMKVSKQGSTLAGIMDAFSISVSLGLQHGVPLATYVRKYTNMRFEPAGITDDKDLRIATSLVDYIFRRLALDYLTREEREELGVLSTSERMQPTLPGVEEAATPEQDLVEDAGVSSVPPTGLGQRVSDSPGSASGFEPGPAARAEQRDAPLCYQCGMVMQRAGSCYVCASCGSTSGCS